MLDMVPTAVGDIQQQEDSNRSGDDTEDEEGLGSSSEDSTKLTDSEAISIEIQADLSDGCDRGSDAGSLAPSDFTRWPAGLARFPRNDTDLVLRQQIKQASCSNRNELALLQTTCLNDMANVRAGRLLDMDMLPVYGVDLANFEPNAVGSTVWKERVIIFEIDAYAYECLSSDCTSWMLHHMTLITPSYNIKLTAKRHPSWSLKSPREAHRMSVERVYTQRFLQSTLDEYQSLILWAHKNSPSERTAHWLGLVAGLRFSMCMFLKEFGAPEKSGYWIVEEPDVGKRLNYISRYNYRPRNPRGAPWEPVIKGFLHYIMDRSMGNQVIAHLDCNEFGVMSNLVLFDRRIPLPKNQDREEFEMAFFHCVHEQTCNEICKLIDLSLWPHHMTA